MPIQTDRKKIFILRNKCKCKSENILSFPSHPQTTALEDIVFLDALIQSDTEAKLILDNLTEFSTDFQ